MSNAIIVEPLAMPGVTASSTAAGHDAAFVANDHMGVTWQSGAGVDGQALYLDMGANVEFDTIAIFGLTGAQPGWQLQVVAADTPDFGTGAWSDGAHALLAGSGMPTSGRGKSLWLAAAGDLPPPKRYIALNFTGLVTSSITVARVVIGKRIQLHRNFQFGAAFGVRDLGSVDWSARGVLLRRRGVKLRSTGLSFPHAHRDEVEAKVNPLLERIGNTDCICLVTDPDAHAQRQNRMYFGPMVGDLGVVWARADGFEARVNVVGLDI